LTELTALGALAFSAFTSATILPGSSEAMLVALSLSHSADPLMLILVASAANTGGSCVNWWMGRFLLRFSDRRWFPASPHQIERAQRWYARYGWPTLLLSWLPVIGDPLTIVAGALRVAFLPFLILVAIAKTARYAFILWALGAF
jgi:membrane protein YqaA with SNARE-associated domain